jgi:hypothetical protein
MPTTPAAAAAATIKEPLDLTTCSSSELTVWLLKERFHGHVDATVSFLQSSCDFLRGATTPITTPTAIAPPSVPLLDVSQSWLHYDIPLRMVHPARTRLTVTCLSHEGFMLSTCKSPPDYLVIRPSSVTMCFVVPPETSTSNTTERILLALDTTNAPVLWKKKPLTFVGWHIPEEMPDWNLPTSQVNDNASHDSNSNDDTTHSLTRPALLHAWKTALHHSLGLDAIITISHDSSFRSFQPSTTTTTGGKPYVACHWGMYPGLLYPLQQGLLCVSSGGAPSVWVPQAHVVASHLGGGRYIDWQCTMRESDSDTTTSSIEFTTIHRDELPGLERYVQTILLPWHNDTAEEVSGKGEEEEEVTTSRKRPRRQASRQAQRINQQHLQQIQAQKKNDDDEEDDDESEENDDDYGMTESDGSNEEDPDNGSAHSAGDETESESDE